MINIFEASLNKHKNMELVFIQGPDTSPGGDQLSEQSEMVGDVRCRYAYSISKSNYLILVL